MCSVKCLLLPDTVRWPFTLGLLLGALFHFPLPSSIHFTSSSHCWQLHYLVISISSLVELWLAPIPDTGQDELRSVFFWVVSLVLLLVLLLLQLWR